MVSQVEAKGSEIWNLVCQGQPVSPENQGSVIRIWTPEVGNSICFRVFRGSVFLNSW